MGNETPREREHGVRWMPGWMSKMKMAVKKTGAVSVLKIQQTEPTFVVYLGMTGEELSLDPEFQGRQIVIDVS